MQCCCREVVYTPHLYLSASRADILKRNRCGSFVKDKTLIAKLIGGLPPVAVCAAHITFLNLVVDTLPRPIPCYKQTNSPCLICTFSMVEFENYRIALATINAGMRLQILIYLLCLFITQFIPALSMRPFVVIVVSVIAILPIFFKA